MTRRRVAVVGGGVAGLTAAHVLQRECDVSLFEADDRLGGHAHTHELVDDDGATVNVDTGFIVFNRRTYPYLLRLFDELGVASQESDMSMSIRCQGCGLEYAGGRGLAGIFPTWRTALRVRYLRMLWEVVRFHRRARAVLAHGDDQQTLDQFVTTYRFSSYFVAHFLTPLVAAVWSVAPEQAGRYPAAYLFQFLAHHGMLQVTGSPVWRTVTGGSARYVELVAKGLTQVRVSARVQDVRKVNNGVDITVDGSVEHYDAAVIATHAHQALAMLARPTELETRALGGVRYSNNLTLLHRDTSVLPRSRRAAASWNYLGPAGCGSRRPLAHRRASPVSVDGQRVHVSYDLNRLQRLSTATRYLVTLNDEATVPAEQIISRMAYEHPIYTPETRAAQALLPQCSDHLLAFAGAYHGWGFHEDGARSGVAAALSLGVRW